MLKYEPRTKRFLLETNDTAGLRVINRSQVLLLIAEASDALVAAGPPAPSRVVEETDPAATLADDPPGTDIGPGDYVKIGSRWAKVAGNTAFGSPTTPRNWTVRTEDGAAYGMWQINAYAKAQDLET
jgi:hypothetical protein